MGERGVSSYPTGPISAFARPNDHLHTSSRTTLSSEFNTSHDSVLGPFNRVRVSSRNQHQFITFAHHRFFSKGHHRTKKTRDNRERRTNFREKQDGRDQRRSSPSVACFSSDPPAAHTRTHTHERMHTEPRQRESSAFTGGGRPCVSFDDDGSRRETRDAQKEGYTHINEYHGGQ